MKKIFILLSFFCCFLDNEMQASIISIEFDSCGVIYSPPIKDSLNKEVVLRNEWDIDDSSCSKPDSKGEEKQTCESKQNDDAKSEPQKQEEEDSVISCIDNPSFKEKKDGTYRFHYR